jgi:hypothetical protein
MVHDTDDRDDRGLPLSRRQALSIGGAGLAGSMVVSGNRNSAEQPGTSGSAGSGCALPVTTARAYVAGDVSSRREVLAHSGDRYLDLRGGPLPPTPVGDPRFVCLSRGSLNVRDFGAVGDGRTDDSAAFEAAYQAILQQREPGLLDGELSARTSLRIPAGRFLITKANAMMAALGGPRTVGLTYEGEGTGSTEIIFAPDGERGNLLTNVDVWRSVSWRGITFVSTSPGASWMASTSHGGAQDYRFQDVTWTGTWDAGLTLTGTNNNSEFVWDRCGVHGEWATGFLCIGFDTGDAASTQDQFLNYWFNDCRVEYRNGYFINAPFGGSITCRNGSYIITEAGTFFYFPRGDHADGSQRLKVDSVRFETRRPASKIIESAWKGGIIHFTNCDNSVESSFGMENSVRADFRSLNDSMPVILWQNCALEGVHRYAYDINSWQAAPRIRYESCHIRQHRSAHDFVRYENMREGLNRGGTPPVLFEGCRGAAAVPEAARDVAFDCLVGWQVGKSASPGRHAVRLASPEGDGLPHAEDASGFSVMLPRFSVVTGLKLYKPAGLGSSTITGSGYRLQTSEAVPTVLAVVEAPPGLSWVDWVLAVDVTVAPLLLDTDERRTLRVTASNVDQRGPSPAFALVEYLA